MTLVKWSTIVCVMCASVDCNGLFDCLGMGVLMGQNTSMHNSNQRTVISMTKVMT